MNKQILTKQDYDSRKESLKIKDEIALNRWNILSKENEKKILKILRNKNELNTITRITKISGLSRCSVRVMLAKLEGAEKIEFKVFSNAKLYYLNKTNEDQDE